MVASGGRTLINHLTYNVHNILSPNAFRFLLDHICVSAYDNSDQVDQMKCYPGTRTLLLERLESWLAAPGNTGLLLTWLNGPMGSGKTAVARTMAERVSAKNKLIGIFIFKRGQSGRNNSTRFVATLAYQLALSIPFVRPHIEDQLVHDPSVLQQSLSRQLEVLILEPLRRMRSQRPDIDISTLPNLVIVDGLDECGADESAGKEEMQTRVLDLLHRLALSQDILPFVILIVSRPERHIKSWFNMESNEPMTNRLSLDSSYKPDDDLRLFIPQSFIKILAEHPGRLLLPVEWPNMVTYPGNGSANAPEILVRRCSGQFIYAAVAMKFIASQHHRPDKRLLSVLSSDQPQSTSTPDVPFAIIDALYLQVLDSVDDHDTAKRLLAFQLIFLGMSTSTGNLPLTRILSILCISIQDFHHSLEQLESLLALRMKPFLQFHHSSFSEFLTDKSRSGPGGWFLDLYHYHSLFFVCTLQLFRDETYIGAQTSYLRGIDYLSSFTTQFVPTSTDTQRELKMWYDFPHTSYSTAVSRFLSKSPLSSFIRLTGRTSSIYPIDSRAPQNTFLFHIANIIKPHVEPYLVHPRLFGFFLCWALGLPGFSLHFQDVSQCTPPNHRWPADLRRILFVLAAERGDVFYMNDFLRFFSIPSRSFLQKSLFVVLKTLEKGLRCSRRWKPRQVFNTKTIQTLEPRDQLILREIFRTIYVSPKLWIYVLDCEESFPPDFRYSLQEFFDISHINSNVRNEFLYLYNPGQHQINSMTVSPLDFALLESTWSLEQRTNVPEPHWHYFFLKNSSYDQILIPGVQALERYLAYSRWFRSAHEREVMPVTTAVCTCGWVDFTPLQNMYLF